MRATDREIDARITHFIPSVELKGSLARKLRTLDTLIGYLVELRASLAGTPADARGGVEGPSRRASAPAWPWCAAGAAVAAIVLLMTIAARGWR